MINVNDTIKSAYKSDEFLGNVSFTIGANEYNERNILASSTSITESLSSGENIDFRAVEKSCFETTLINITENIKELKGKTLTMKQTVLNTDIPLGVYTIVDAVNDGDYLYDITAYDNLYKFEVDVSDWWNEEVSFPITLRNLLISLCAKLDVQYEFPTTFTNSNFSVERNTYLENVSGAEVLGYIQEVCAGFIRPDRNGVFKLIQLIYEKPAGLYPATDLYPSTSLYPRIENEFDPNVIYDVPVTMDKLQIADYMVSNITKLQIRGTEDDIGVIVGSGDNAYIIESNPLLYSFTGSVDDIEVATNILNIISQLQYTPISTTVKAFPYIEVGDLVRAVSYEGKEAIAPLLYRSMSGFLINTDKIEINGTETRKPTTSSANRSVRILNQRLHEYIVSLTELRSTIREVSSELTDIGTQVTTNETNIDQLADSITLTVAQSIQNYMTTEGVDEFIENAKMIFQFTIDGLQIAKQNGDGTVTAAYSSLFTNNGMRVISTSTNEATLTAEQDTVVAENLTANQYFRISVPNAGSRFQEYHSTIHNDDEVGCFWEAI